MENYLLILNFCRVGHVFISTIIDGHIKKRRGLQSEACSKNPPKP